MRTIFLTIFLSATFASFSHNGKTAYAYPIENICIDGLLNDWPSSTIKYPIGGKFLGPDQKVDYSGYFMVAYNLVEQVLYIALEVKDDSNVVGNMEGDVFTRNKDRHILYIDAEHSKSKGSGTVVFFGSRAGLDFWKIPTNWDPFHQNMGKENAKLKVRKKGNTLIYEWRIHLGENIVINKSIGLDHEVVDADENGTKTHLWGPGGFKNRVPSRMGDVVLMQADQKLADLNGTIIWDMPLEEELPSSVKIISRDNDLLWTQASVDSTGNYSVHLPEGKYHISSAHKTSNALNFSPKKTRVNDKAEVAIDLVGGTTRADTLKISWYEVPEFLIPEEGLLHSYKESQSFQVDNFVETFRQYYNIPGLSLALVKGGKIVYNKGFGTKNIMTGEPVTEKTIFETASISKAVCAFAINRLAENGAIDLDKPLFEYLPFENIAGDPRSKAITARMVLSHQTGLPNWAFGGPFGWMNGKKTKLLFEPGTKYGYSGEGFEYLKRAIEKITGKDIETIVHEEVFEIMNMVETSLTGTPKLMGRIGIGHLSDLPMFWALESRPWIAGSMYSTSRDLANYLIGLMNGVGLSKEGYAEMFKPQVENKEPFIHFFGGDKQFQSLGFEIQESPYGGFLHHGGNNGDYQGRLAMDSNKKIGFVLLTNSSTGFQMDLALQAFLITGRNGRPKLKTD